MTTVITTEPAPTPAPGTEPAFAEPETLADLLTRLGDVPPGRVLMKPAPGTATEEDWIRVNSQGCGAFELVDGTLVRKAMGAKEGGLATILSGFLFLYLRGNRIGKIFGEHTFFRMSHGGFLAPDLTFVRTERFVTGRVERVWILETGFDLAVEVLSRSNSPREIRQKTEEYFASGVSLVWVADPGTRTVRVHTSPDAFRELADDDTLEGGEVLPGFTLSVREWFDEGDSAS